MAGNDDSVLSALGMTVDELVDGRNWERTEQRLRDLARASGENVEDLAERLIDQVRHEDFGRAFLLWGRMSTSECYDMREAASDRTWNFVRPQHMPFLKEVWQQVPRPARQVFIGRVFMEYPGEPFESMRRPYDYPLRKGWIMLLPTGYFLSSAVRCLRRMVEDAGDKYSLELIDELIEERRRACELGARAASQQRERYLLSADERELAARLMTMARRVGFQAAVLPQVTVSYEAPPAFVANPELEDAEARNLQDSEVPELPERNVPTDCQRPVPEVFSIEELLGCYRPRTEDIVLWQRGISWAARRYGISEGWLASVVLIHEFGHWLAHKLAGPRTREWPLDLYIGTSEEVHECWAQLMVWYVAASVGGQLKHAFEDLSKRQPASYRTWERFRTLDPSRAFAALAQLRRLRQPAELGDWEALVA